MQYCFLAYLNECDSDLKKSVSFSSSFQPKKCQIIDWRTPPHGVGASCWDILDRRRKYIKISYLHKIVASIFIHVQTRRKIFPFITDRELRSKATKVMFWQASAILFTGGSASWPASPGVQTPPPSGQTHSQGGIRPPPPGQTHHPTPASQTHNPLARHISPPPHQTHQSPPARHTPPPLRKRQDTVIQRSVRILLECIFVDHS